MPRTLKDMLNLVLKLEDEETLRLGENTYPRAQVFLMLEDARGDWSSGLRRYHFYCRPTEGRTAMFMSAPDYTMGAVDGTVSIAFSFTYSGVFVSATDWLETTMAMIQLPDESGRIQNEQEWVDYLARLHLLVGQLSRFD